MTVPPEIVGGVLLDKNTDKEIPFSVGETLLAMTLAEIATEIVRIREAVEAVIADPGNPFSAADKAKEILAAAE